MNNTDFIDRNEGGWGRHNMELLTPEAFDAYRASRAASAPQEAPEPPLARPKQETRSRICRIAHNEDCA